MSSNLGKLLGPDWAKLPRLAFTRAAPPSSGEEIEQSDKAYGVRTGEILAAEFDNRLQRIRNNSATDQTDPSGPVARA